MTTHWYHLVRIGNDQCSLIIADSKESLKALVFSKYPLTSQHNDTQLCQLATKTVLFWNWSINVQTGCQAYWVDNGVKYTQLFLFKKFLRIFSEPNKDGLSIEIPNGVAYSVRQFSDTGVASRTPLPSEAYTLAIENKTLVVEKGYMVQFARFENCANVPLREPSPVPVLAEHQVSTIVIERLDYLNILLEEYRSVLTTTTLTKQHVTNMRNRLDICNKTILEPLTTLVDKSLYKPPKMLTELHLQMIAIKSQLRDAEHFLQMKNLFSEGQLKELSQLIKYDQGNEGLGQYILNLVKKGLDCDVCTTKDSDDE